jgi:hypothetical protein
VLQRHGPKLKKSFLVLFFKKEPLPSYGRTVSIPAPPAASVIPGLMARLAAKSDTPILRQDTGRETIFRSSPVN